MRVLDLSRTVAGGYCAQMLRLIGADVQRIDVTGAGVPSLEPKDEIALAFVNQGKFTLPNPINLDVGPDRAGICSAIADSLANCVIEDWGPGGIEAHALGHDLLQSLTRSPMVLTRISEFGQDGPWAQWAGSELVNLAAGGMLFLTGSWERPPVQLAPYQAQLTTGLLAAVATAAALLSGRAVTIDLSKQEAVLSLVTPALTDYAYRGTIPAREGQVAAMARIERAQDDWVYAGPGAAATANYQRYAALLGIPEFAEPRFASADSRMEHWDEHQQLLLPRLRERTAREWVDGAAAQGMTFGLVQSTADLLQCEVLAERAFFAHGGPLDQPVPVPLAPFLVDGERPRSAN